MRKGRSSRKEKICFCQIFLEEKIAKENISTQEFFFTTFGKKWRIEIRFVFEKSTKMRIQRREVSTIEFFFTTKRRCCFPIFQRSFLHCENRHWKNDLKRLFSETMLQKKKRRKEGSGDETTLIGDHHPSSSSHNTNLTEHAIWLFTKFSETSINFFFKWWEKANASRQEYWPPYRCIAFGRSSTVSEHSKFGELVVKSHTAMYWMCGTTTGSCTTLSSTIGKLNNSTSQTSVLSRP